MHRKWPYCECEHSPKQLSFQFQYHPNYCFNRVIVNAALLSVFRCQGKDQLEELDEQKYPWQFRNAHTNQSQMFTVGLATPTDFSLSVLLILRETACESYLHL